MYGICTTTLGCIQYFSDVQIGFAGAFTAERDGRICFQNKGRVSITIGINGNGTDAHGSCSAIDAPCNFPAVCDQ